MKRLSLLAMLLLIVFTMPVEAGKVHTIGDSTMAFYDENQTVTRGWGMYFGNFLTGDWTSVNYARGGRDSRGGYNELWQTAKNSVKAGDYVLIQFAHNDEKINGVDRDSLYNYYISKGMTTEAANTETRGTVPSTSYKYWLKKIVDEVKALGANPVIVGPVCRSYFSTDGTIRRNGRHDLGDSFSVLTENGVTEKNKVAADDHRMDYPYHAHALADEEQIPYIDLTTATKELYESYGDTKCHEQLFDGDGSTHFNTTGALLVARLCAQLMKEQGILDDNIIVPSDLSVNPAIADLGDGYKGQTATKELTLSGFSLTPAEGTVSITATEGIELSLDRENWTSTLSVDYKNSTLVQTFYARVLLSEAGTVAGAITATLASSTTAVEVPLTGNVIELGGGEPFLVSWPLTSTDEATITGGVTVGDITYSGLAKYGNNAEYGVLAYVEGGWSAAEDDDPNCYVQFSVRCPEGKTVDINSIEMLIGARGGNAMKCHAYYSTDGFRTRSTIYAPTSMTSNTMNEVSSQPVVSLEEGEELLLRVYPWYTGNATGKYICIKDVSIGGQVKSAGGINIDGTITLKMDKGTLAQADEAVFSPDEMKAGIAAVKLTAGSALTINGTTTYTGQNNEKTTQTAIYNGTGAQFAGSATDDNTLTLTLTPEDGYNFVPTAIYFEAARYGTDGGTITASIGAGQNSQQLCEKANVNRSGKNLDLMTFSYNVSNIVASFDDPLKVSFSFVGLGNTKTMGLSNIVITGQLVGSSSTATKYVLTTNVDPAGAGTITREPDLTAYKEGAEVVLTATKNFGYRFLGWADASGQTVSTSTSMTVKMDSEKTFIARFESVPVYTITTRTTNDAELALGSITLTPNEHNNQYEAGTEITATANESKILKFLQWTDGGENAGTSATRAITVNGNMELVANYEVQDFIAVFDASANNYYAYATTTGYPFPADITLDNDRNASSAVVKVSDGSLAYTQDGGTPVVRNRNAVVLSSIDGLYQNGYSTTDVAFQFQFSTKGFTSATFTADMAAKNMASRNWQALVATDGKTFTAISKWEMTANVVMPLSIELPATCIGQENVTLRIMGDGDDMLSSSYQFDQTFDGLKYTSHSESGVGNVYVLGTAEVVADDVAPVVTATLPADGATDVSATGRITISYDERITPGSVDGSSASPALTAADGTTALLDVSWSSRSVSFSYMGLSYGTQYTFTLPAGYVADRSGNPADALTLTFTTMERRQPEARLYDAVVDGTANAVNVPGVSTSGIPSYATVQAAIDAAPAGRTKPWLIFVKNGRYNEHVDIPATKPHIHIIGQQRDKAVILDDRLCGGDNAYSVDPGATVVVKGDDAFFENITLENSYGYEKLAGPQALALNTVADRVCLNRVALLSYQDTWITTSNQKARHYIKNSLIEGAVDFIYNGGDVYLDGDTLQINRPSGGYIVAPRHTTETKWGYVFQNNIIRPRPGIDVKDVWLGRPWHDQPKTVFINTQTFVNIPAKGWYNTMGGLPALWAEYNTTDASGKPVDLSQRETYYYYTDNSGIKHEVTGVKNTLTAEEASEYTLRNVVGGDDGWQPDLMCEACEAPVATIANGTISWDAVPYAICYVVTQGDDVVAITTDTEVAVEGSAAEDYKVQAVNEWGGLSQYGAATAAAPTGISESAIHPSHSGQAGATYDLQGRRTVRRSDGSLMPRVVIERGADGTARKIVR